MYVVTEIMDLSQIPMMLDYVDVFWVGARNMQNSFLLKALGKVDRPVILKNGLASTMEEFLYAAEYIVSSGNPNVMLMMRGIRTYEKWTRNTLDMGTIAVLKQESHLPVIVDISHSAGRRDIAKPLARGARALGADGLMVEVHPNPPVAMSDAKQQLTIPEFHATVLSLNWSIEPIIVLSAIRLTSAIADLCAQCLREGVAVNHLIRSPEIRRRLGWQRLGDAERVVHPRDDADRLRTWCTSRSRHVSAESTR